LVKGVFSVGSISPSGPANVHFLSRSR
jgi:hypothetical protein